MPDHQQIETPLIAHGITVVGEEGPAYGPLDLELPDKKLVFLSGRGGSGRTALALTLSGRMKPTEGTLEVFGHKKVKHIRESVAIAGVDAIDALDRNIKVRDVLNEHRAWSHGWFKWVARVDDNYRDRILGPVYGERSLPDLDLYVSQIPSLDRLLIRIALSLHPAHRGHIQMLVLDDLEQVRELTDRIVLIDALERLSQDILVIVNSVNPPPEEIFDNAMVIPLFTDRAHATPKQSGLRGTRLGRISRKWVVSKAQNVQHELTLGSDDVPDEHVPPTSTNSHGATYTDASKVPVPASAHGTGSSESTVNLVNTATNVLEAESEVADAQALEAEVESEAAAEARAAAAAAAEAADTADSSTAGSAADAPATDTGEKEQ